MPICVHCARPVPSLLITFGSGHVVLTRCGYADAEKPGFNRIADPYLEYDGTTLFIDLVSYQIDGDVGETPRIPSPALQ